MLIIMKKILVIHTKYRITGGEDIAVDSEVATLKKYFNVETLYFQIKILIIFLNKFFLLSETRTQMQIKSLLKN